MIGGTTAVNAGWAPTQLEASTVPYIVSYVGLNMKIQNTRNGLRVNSSKYIMLMFA